MDANNRTTSDLANIATALDVAVKADFMSREHGALIWKKVLKESNLDIPKKAPQPPTPKTEEVKPEEKQ